MTVLERPDIQLEFIGKLLTLTGASQNVSDMLDLVLGALAELLDTDGNPSGNGSPGGADVAFVGGVYLVESDYLSLASHRGLGSFVEELCNVSVQHSIWFAHAGDGVAAQWATASQLDDPSMHALWRLGYSDVVALPLTSVPQINGYLFFGLKEPWPEELVAGCLLDCMSRALGSAVDRARSHTQMERQLRESQAIYQISRTFVATSDLDRLLDHIVHSAANTIDEATDCVLHLLDQETGELAPRALTFAQISPGSVGLSHMRIGHGVAGVALQEGTVVNVRDVHNDPRFVRTVSSRPFSSMLVAPLKLGELRIGTLSVDSIHRHAFSENDERLLMTLAMQAAAAIENARLVRDLQRSVEALRSTQAQLVQSEKLSAIGQLIAGVAHELNNPLTAVMGYAQLLQTTPGMAEDTIQDLTRIYSQAGRAAKIVQNLLTFAREHKAERRLVDVNEIIRRTLELRSYQLRVDNIELVTQLDEAVSCTMADASQLQQVFLNLINNALDAMTAARMGGTLIVRSDALGDTIRVRVTDDGPGLSPQVQKHLFEPFFTTKEVGKGTGLGLSICFGIVGQHGGRIWAESEFGYGATFFVELPCVGDRHVQTADELPEPVYCRSGKQILIVEDEPEVAGVLRRALAQDGHQVVMADNGAEALDVIAQAHEMERSFELVISDLKMPQVNGRSLYEQIQEQDPALARRVMFITGDTLSPETGGFLKETDLPYLMKPFTIDELRRLVIQLLDRQPAPSAPL